jgi:hypothetical protein
MRLPTGPGSKAKKKKKLGVKIGSNERHFSTLQPPRLAGASEHRSGDTVIYGG